MRCSYCRKEVIHGSVSCPDCGRACLQMVDPSVDGGMEPSLMDAALTLVSVDMAVENQPMYDNLVSEPSPVFDGFGGGDSGGGGATGDF